MNSEKRSFLQPKMLCSAGTGFINWLKILAASKFQVGFKYIPDVMLITLISILFSPFALLEKIIFSGRIKKTPVKSPVFIIGHMRSGTTFLHYLLSRDGQFGWISTVEAVFPRIFLVLRGMARFIIGLTLPSKRPMDNMPTNLSLPQEEEFAIANLCPYSPNNGAYFPRNLEKGYNQYAFLEDVPEKVVSKWGKIYTSFLKKISYDNGGKRVLSKNIANACRIDKLVKLFPDAKFIFIYRNPYKVFFSTKKLYKKFIFEHMSYQDISDEELEEVILKVAKKGFEKYLETRNLIPPGNLYEIKFEDFVEKPLFFLEDIYTKLELGDFEKTKGSFEEYLEGFKNYKPDSYSFDEEVKKRIYASTSKLFEEFGYEK